MIIRVINYLQKKQNEKISKPEEKVKNLTRWVFGFDRTGAQEKIELLEKRLVELEKRIDGLEKRNIVQFHCDPGTNIESDHQKMKKFITAVANHWCSYHAEDAQRILDELEWEKAE